MPASRLQDLAFFLGEWSGKGVFASGRTIEADVSFALDLDGKVLSYRHTDRLPNTFKALSVWRFNSENNHFTAVMHDNFGGVRQFYASGWLASQLVFEKQEADGESAKLGERIVFKKLTPTTFKMTYERDRHDGRGWQWGDYVVFTKK